mgnify:CR=1 FL=1
MNDTHLNDLIGSRICHDLISPIGAIGNGVELLGLTGPPSPEVRLIADSVAGDPAWYVVRPGDNLTLIARTYTSYSQKARSAVSRGNLE